MRSFLELLKKNGSILLIGLLLGLVFGFKLANSKFRGAQLAAIEAQAAKAAANLGNAPRGAEQGHAQMPSESQVNSVIERARANPNDYEAQLDAADQYLQIQRAEGAQPFLQQALKLKPEDPRAMNALSTSYLFTGKYNDAALWARRALAKKPDDLGTKLLLVLSLVESRQNLNEADQLLRQIEQAKPGDKMLADARASLEEARKGGGKASDPAKTTLDHGSAPERPPSATPKSGGQR
jgi:tetratricopeptide (TPR) repeat protein